MDWLNSLQNGKIKQIMTTAQTGAQLVSTINQFRQGFSGQNEETSVIQRAQNELTFTSPTAAADSTTNQNLHGEFSKEFLKEIVKKSPALLEEPNPADGCTPLLNAVKRNNFNAAILLLSRGANVHAVDLSGNTALHHAIMARSPQMVKLLLLFRANPNAQNNAGKEAIALKTSSEVAELLSHIRAHAENGVIDSSDKERVGSAKMLQSKCEQIRQDQAIHYQRSKTAEEKSNSIRMLSLDGGGIRGLVLIQMLMELEELRAYGQDGKKTRTAGSRKTFVQRNFDWIAGTSTGAILALALADGTQLIDCLRLYLRLKDEIFCATIRPYPSECIEGFLKEQFGANRKMADLRSGKTRVFVTATKADQIPIKLVLFRNYRTPFNPHPEYEPEKMQIWKAARCSSAAPTYFSSVNGIMDGGLIANNPGATLLLELSRQIDAIKANLLNAERIPDLAYLLSLGTGKTPEVPISVADVDLGKGFSVQSIIQTANALSNLKSILVEQLATSDGQVVETSREIAHSRNAPYFRLTPSLQSDIQLDTVNNTQLIDMLWNTKIYMREKCSTELLALLTLMREFERDD